MKNIFKLTNYLFLLFALSLMPFVFSTKVLAAPTVVIVKLPEYLNDREFEISYTALVPGGEIKTVTVQYMKDGGSWQTVDTLTTASGKVKLINSQINEDKKYYFKAIACDTSDVCVSDETSTTIDTAAPPKPENYSKEKISNQTYKIKWHNPGSDDLYKTYVYRSDKQDFDLNSGTEIAQVDITKNTDSEYVDWNVPDSSKAYYYALRNVDKAMNASDPIGDTYTTYVEVSPSPGEEGAGDQQSESGNWMLETGGSNQSAGGQSGQVLGEEGAQESPNPSTEEVVLGSEEATAPAEAETLIPRWVWFVGLGLILVGAGYYLSRKK